MQNQNDQRLASKAKAKLKIHYGNYTLGLRGLCGREVKSEQLTRNEKEVNCKKCEDMMFR